MKKFSILLVTVLLVFCCSFSVSAATDGGQAEPGTAIAPESNIIFDDDIGTITPFFTIVDGAGLSVVRDSQTRITAYATTRGKSNAVKVTAQTKLYRKATNSSTWTLWKSGILKADYSGDFIGTEDSWTIVPGYDYKVVGTHVAYSSSSSETTTTSRVIYY